MTNPTDTIIALEKALKAGPTDGTWTWSEPPGAGIEVRGPYKGNTRLLFSDIWRQFPEQAWDAEMRANAAWVTACSPLAIRTLLDAHASALRDAARLDWLVARMSDRDFREIGLSYRCGDKSIRPAIDAQMAALDDNTKGAPQ